MTVDEMVQFLKYNGYTEYPNKLNHKNERMFQKSFIDGDNGKRSVSIHMWDMSDINSVIPLSFEVKTTFETSHGGWFTGNFYTNTPKELTEKLKYFEDECKRLFNMLGGYYQ